MIVHVGNPSSNSRNKFNALAGLNFALADQIWLKARAR